MSSVLNNAAVKKYVMGQLEVRREGMGFTRISKEYLEKLDARVRIMIQKDIDTHPTIGKTFKP